MYTTQNYPPLVTVYIAALTIHYPAGFNSWETRVFFTNVFFVSQRPSRVFFFLLVRAGSSLIVGSISFLFT